MKKILKYFIAVTLLIFASCEKEKHEILDMKISPEEVTKIELRADHKTIIPNEISKMEFYPYVYAKRMVKSYKRNDDNTFSVKEIEEEFLVPKDQVPDEFVKIYDQNNKELKDRIFSASNVAPGTQLSFYAKCKNLESNRLTITVRDLPAEPGEEIVIPVVFHLLLLPQSTGPTYEVSVEYLQKQLKLVEDVFNARMTTDPNAGKTNVKFKLAIFNKDGVEMQEKGKNIYNLSTSEVNSLGTSTDKSTAYKKIILENKSTLIWDPTKYLNIWLTKFTTSTSALGSSSYKVLAPKYIHSSYDEKTLPGLKLTKKDSFTYSDVTDCLEAGFMVNYTTFYKSSTQGANEFSLATVVATYLGILNTQCDKYSKLNPDGDSDYCPDTYSFDYGFYDSIYKGNNLDGQPENDPTRPLEYFTSFNVMDIYSKKNSISADQAVRARVALKECPSLWCYKSSFALTGEN